MKFAVATPLIAFFTLDILVETLARAAHDGKYDKKKYGNGNHGKYVHTNGGDYVEDLDRYRYVHYDDGDRGRYIHVHIPYDGGYGNYEGGHEPFRNPPYDASGLYAYVQKPKNESCLRLLEQYSNTCSDSSLNNPFKSNEFDIRQPSIYLEYGTPDPEYVDASSRQEKLTSASSARETDPRASTFPGTSYLPVPKPHTEYGPPERTRSNNVEASTKSTSTRSFDVNSISLTTVSGQESKIRLVTESPATTRTQVSVSRKSIPETTETISPATSTVTTPTTTRTSTTATTTPTTKVSTTSAASTVQIRASIDEQLHQCRSELQTALLKLSHNERSKCD
ncbi:AAEL003255-PA [Aedes aegypti]|uniref:AAEL003255-PA n=1 Tax=Aedes aegypti TaxID=7159 RepID=Q17G26_AEDAE|nr:AAEL003255-PA [Aedes aegypti]